ncbi:SMC-Scp complex subunit ScpB [Clostridium cellulovorans]|uniref:Segregation and condensation protein B n=1 Tax=Clostridium cellulovorans (strain ATCC 35296 / DSM 3052 / OCM 3 / 743B) TaxID=573061 RepID=D9SM57_CLOC7|nr:SMC-Scp complex subunit ScpB [Clostridium cellulovorans]ADL51788.1 chromosome segregation and condensation protein, ScpB [Clostridium cellulovorans 743B]
MRDNMNQIEFIDNEEESRLFSIIESLLFVSGEPLNIKQISEIIECSYSKTLALLESYGEELSNSKRGIKLMMLEDNYQLVTKEENAEFIQRLLKTNSRQSLSQAALETLAIIAYKQPITRVDVDEIRGVKSDRAIYTLVEKKLIKESGRMDIPGRPILYATTDEFLRYFQLENLKQLPNLEELEELIAIDADVDIDNGEEE